MWFKKTNHPEFVVIVRANILKNLLALVVALLLTPGIAVSLRSSLTSQNVGDFLVVLSILLVTVCFANFAFSYEHLPRGFLQELLALAHAATFLFMLLMGVLLIAVTVVIQIAYPTMFLLALGFNALLYLAMMLYDLWDSLRMLNR
ncbi:MAG: hypothetical protein G01um101431_427 [Parcubacteria group bacterium Gr01-1014_31]|nr:MAG: hypothetical protein G01um101431_427 [Parcubacteria group bacterium Gr01-1014_31]